jgi:hypothetical protein
MSRTNLFISRIAGEWICSVHTAIFFIQEKEIEIMKIKKSETVKRVTEKMKDINRKVIVPAITGTVFAINGITTTVFATTDTSAVTKPLDNLKTLVIAIIGAVGVIILAKNVMEFAQAYQQQDSSTMNSALKGIVAGVMMAGISSVLSILGF